VSLRVAGNGYVLAMVGHLKTVYPTFEQKPNKITNVEFTTVSPTIAKPLCNIKSV
jgi:mannose/fructose/N-acetylgalactosamine-specific phosphotransferase system component IID